MSAAINPVPSTYMNAQLDNTFAHRLDIAKIARLNLAQPNTNTRLRHLVTQAIQPFRKRFPAVITLIAKQFNHSKTVV